MIPAGANTVSRTIQVSSTPGRTETPTASPPARTGRSMSPTSVPMMSLSSSRAPTPWPTASMSRADPRRPPRAGRDPLCGQRPESSPVRNTARGHSDRPLHPDREQPRSPRGSSGRDHHRDDPGQRRGKRFRGPLRHRRCSCAFGPRPSLGTGIRRDPTRRRGDNPVELPGRNRWNGRSSSSRHRPAHRGHATPANGVPSRPRQRIRGTPRRSPQRRFLERARRCRPKQVIWPELA